MTAPPYTRKRRTAAPAAPMWPGKKLYTIQPRKNGTCEKASDQFVGIADAQLLGQTTLPMSPPHTDFLHFVSTAVCLVELSQHHHCMRG